MDNSQLAIHFPMKLLRRKNKLLGLIDEILKDTTTSIGKITNEKHIASKRNGQLVFMVKYNNSYKCL